MSLPPDQPTNDDAALTRRVWRYRGPALIALLLIALVAYVASGVYTVQPDQLGVVRIFGKLVADDVPPGIHYAPPWPIGRVDRPRITEVRRIGVGFTLGDEQPPLVDTELLTGDENILVITLIAQYRVDKPADFLFATESPGDLVDRSARAVLLDTVGRMPVDEVLTVAKGALQSQIQIDAQKLLTQYGSGVRLISTDLQIVDPPLDVVQAFKDVASAKKDREKLIDEAVAYRNAMLPKASGQAHSLIEKAHADATSRINRARGEADRFCMRLTEYRKAPDITRRRLLLDTLERVLPTIKTYVVDAAPDGPTTHIRIIEQP